MFLYKNTKLFIEHSYQVEQFNDRKSKNTIYVYKQFLKILQNTNKVLMCTDSFYNIVMRHTKIEISFEKGKL